MDQLADAAFGTSSDPARPKDLSKNLSGGPGPSLTNPPEVPAPTSSPKVVHASGSGSTKAETSKPSDKKSVEESRRYFCCICFESFLQYFNFY